MSLTSAEFEMISSRFERLELAVTESTRASVELAKSVAACQGRSTARRELAPMRAPWISAAAAVVASACALPSYLAR